MHFLPPSVIFGIIDFVFPVSSIEKKFLDVKDAEAAIRINRINNPRIHSVANTDCASCHIADIYIDELSKEGVDLSSPQDRYQNDHWNLNTNHKKGAVDIQMRATLGAGYVVSQRVINDTAESMDWIMKNVARD